MSFSEPPLIEISISYITEMESKREVKMAVYSPSCLFFFSRFCGSWRSIKNAKEANIQPSRPNMLGQ